LATDFADLDFRLVQGIAFQYFNLQDAVDNGGVPTKAVSLNATVDLQLYNPSGMVSYAFKLDDQTASFVEDVRAL
jgi:hypothetical protein